MSLPLQEEESESEEEIISNEPAVMPQTTPSQSPASSQQPLSSSTSATGTGPRPASGSTPGSRATSPISSQAQSGHLIVAMRATSPKLPKPKVAATGTAGTSRASSPLAQDARAQSPPGSPNPSGSRASPHTPSGTPKTNKRKAEDDGESSSVGSAGAGAGAGATAAGMTNTEPRAKKRKAAAAVDANGNPIELTDQMVIEWLRTTENATTRDCITYFTPYLRDKTAKENFTKLIKEVASLKGGVLTLRSQYRGSSTSSNGGYRPSVSPDPVEASGSSNTQGMMDTSV